MSKAAFIRARIEPELKDLAEEVLDELGITPTQAITMLYKKIARDHEWPIDLKIPNAQTRKALEETDKGDLSTLIRANNLELFERGRDHGKT